MNEEKSICRVCGGAHITGECIGAARVSIPAIKRSDNQVIDDAVSGPVRFFDVPTDPNAQPLDDEDKTPVVSIQRTVPKNTVTEISLADVYSGLRGGEVAEANVRGADHRAHLEVVNERELEHVFDDVEAQRDSEVVGFIKRGIANENFQNISQFELCVKELFGGDNDPAGVWNMEDLKPLTEMVVELRVQIGDERPLVEVYLANEKGQGNRKGKNITRVVKARIQETKKPVDVVPPIAPKAKKSWGVATALVKMVRDFGDKNK